MKFFPCITILNPSQRLGGCEKIDSSTAIQEAVTLAAESDAVIFIGGLTPEWESEGFDRPTLDMPGLQNQTIARIAAANPNTIVVIQAVRARNFPLILEFIPSSSIIQGFCCINALGERCRRDYPSLVFWK